MDRARRRARLADLAGCGAPQGTLGKSRCTRASAQATVSPLATSPSGLARARAEETPQNTNTRSKQITHPGDALLKGAVIRRLLFFWGRGAVQASTAELVRLCRDRPPERLQTFHNGRIMDDIVRQAIAKWPNVPHCYGWLGLDARGNWYMRDDRTQAAGAFPLSKGSLLKHEKLVEFIHRNYERDERGCWFFQNGPQRVYVELESSPWIWRISPGQRVTSHSGRTATPQRCVVDDEGHLYLGTDIGFGLIHTLDMEAAADAIEQGIWTPEEIAAAELPARFGFIRSPQGLQPGASPHSEP